jgi:flagellar biosynthesis component FlhA
MKRNLRGNRLSELLTEQEIKKLLEAATDPYEKAIIEIMWETPFLPEEWLILKKTKGRR